MVISILASVGRQWNLLLLLLYKMCFLLFFLVLLRLGLHKFLRTMFGDLFLLLILNHNNKFKKD